VKNPYEASDDDFYDGSEIDNSERELIAQENMWAKAYLARDVATLDRLEAEDWVCTTADGQVIPKAQDMKEVASGTYQASEFFMSDLKVRVHGDTAIVTGRQTEVATMAGKDASAVFQISDTWIRHDGRWQCLATHLSKIAPPTPPAPPPAPSVPGSILLTP